MIASMLITTLVAGCLSFAPVPHNVAATQPDAPQVAGKYFSAPLLAKPFVSEAGRFSIQIPDNYTEPELETNDIPSEIGEIKLYMYTCVNMTEGVCLVGYSDIESITMTDELKMEMLEGAKEGAISNMKATLHSEKEMTIDGHPGRSIQFTTDNDGATLRGRMDYYMVENRLYQIGFIEIANSSLDGAPVQGYFNSFKLAQADTKAKKKKK